MWARTFSHILGYVIAKSLITCNGDCWILELLELKGFEQILKTQTEVVIYLSQSRSSIWWEGKKSGNLSSIIWDCRTTVLPHRLYAGIYEHPLSESQKVSSGHRSPLRHRWTYQPVRGAWCNFVRAGAWMKESTVIQNNCISWRILRLRTQCDWDAFMAKGWKPSDSQSMHQISKKLHSLSTTLP